MSAAQRNYRTPLTKSTPGPSRKPKQPVVHYTYDRHGEPIEIDSMLARQPPNRANGNHAQPAMFRSKTSLDGLDVETIRIARVDAAPLGDLPAETFGESRPGPHGDLTAATSFAGSSHSLGDLTAEPSAHVPVPMQLSLGIFG